MVPAAELDPSRKDQVEVTAPARGVLARTVALGARGVEDTL